MGWMKEATQQSNWSKFILQERIGKNRNMTIMVSGKPGTGKSYACIKLGETLDPSFCIERVVFSGGELMYLVNSGKLKKGNVVVFEEIGVNLSNRNWQSLTNKMLNYWMQTCRHRNFIVLFNAPYMDFADSQTRRLFDAEFATQKIDYRAKTCTLRPQLIQYNARIKKFYYKFLRVTSRVGKLKGLRPIKTWVLSLPSPGLLEEYEKKKTAFTDKLNKEILYELKRAEGKKKLGLSTKDVDLLGMLEAGTSLKGMAEDRNVSISAITQGIDRLRDKGFKIRAEREGDNSIARYNVTRPDVFKEDKE